jgi:hypothetical protein
MPTRQFRTHELALALIAAIQDYQRAPSTERLAIVHERYRDWSRSPESAGLPKPPEQTNKLGEWLTAIMAIVETEENRAPAGGLSALLREATTACAESRGRFWLIASVSDRLQKCKDESEAGRIDETGAALFPFASLAGGGSIKIEERFYSMLLMTRGGRAADEDMQRFHDFARRAGATLLADPCTCTWEIGTCLTPKEFWLGGLLFCAPKPVICDSGCRIHTQPWAASVAFLRDLLYAPKPGTNTSAASASARQHVDLDPIGDKAPPAKENRKAKRKCGRRRLPETDPKVQVYSRIQREHQAGTARSDILERLRSDKDFVEQVAAAKLKLNGKLVKAALAFFEQRKKQETPST